MSVSMADVKGLATIYGQLALRLQLIPDGSKVLFAEAEPKYGSSFGLRYIAPDDPGHVRMPGCSLEGVMSKSAAFQVLTAATEALRAVVAVKAGAGL
jgi:hypothetical protein